MSTLRMRVPRLREVLSYLPRVTHIWEFGVGQSEFHITGGMGYFNEYVRKTGQLNRKISLMRTLSLFPA